MSHHHAIFSEPIYPLLSYFNACAGALLGLACASRFQARGLRGGWSWLAGGATTLGCGIWGMHFIAMLGYSVEGMPLRYDVPLTVLSLVVAIVIVGIGMIIAGIRKNWYTLIAGGLVTGVGVASMHYIGMAALNFSGAFRFDTTLVTASVLIGVAAATAALWATLRVTGRYAMAGAAVIMGLAISGMHYTGMAAAEPVVNPNTPLGDGMEPLTFITPLILGLGAEILIVGLAVLLTPVTDETGASPAAALPPRTPASHRSRG